MRSSQHDASVLGIVREEMRALREEMRDLRSRVGRVEARVDSIDRVAEQLEDEQENTKTRALKFEAEKLEARKWWRDKIAGGVTIVAAGVITATLLWASQRMQCVAPITVPLPIEERKL